MTINHNKQLAEIHERGQSRVRWLQEIDGDIKRHSDEADKFREAVAASVNKLNRNIVRIATKLDIQSLEEGD